MNRPILSRFKALIFFALTCIAEKLIRAADSLKLTANHKEGFDFEAAVLNGATLVYFKTRTELTCTNNSDSQAFFVDGNGGYWHVNITGEVIQSSRKEHIKIAYLINR
jgi:hypothetical protein